MCYQCVTDSCKSDEFQCDSGYGCLPLSGVCDNNKVCKDESDENNCGKILKQECGIVAYSIDVDNCGKKIFECSKILLM